MHIIITQLLYIFQLFNIYITHLVYLTLLIMGNRYLVQFSYFTTLFAMYKFILAWHSTKLGITFLGFFCVVYGNPPPQNFLNVPDSLFLYCW